MLHKFFSFFCFHLYKSIIVLLTPLLPLFLNYRKKKNKEHPTFFTQKFGLASQPRPDGKLMWFHTVSLGEFNSIKFLLQQILTHQNTNILITTTTLTSFTAVTNFISSLAPHLKDFVTHQFFPLDNPIYINRFLSHWKPNVAIFTEAEIWPIIFNTLIKYKHKHNTKLYHINTILSKKSIKKWNILHSFLSSQLGSFNEIFTSDTSTHNFFKTIGLTNISYAGNIKLDNCIYNAQTNITKKIPSDKPLILLISTHNLEEEIILQSLRDVLNTARIIIAPRYLKRISDISSLCNKLHLQYDIISDLPETFSNLPNILIINKMGIMNHLINSSDVTFVCGSFVDGIGGHNIMESIVLEKPTIIGQYHHSIHDQVQILHRLGGINICYNSGDITKITQDLLGNPNLISSQKNAIRQYLDTYSGNSKIIFDTIFTSNS